jgi:deoxyribose-phosphate aldolase
MDLYSADIARLIDISAVQAYHGEKEVRELATQARRHGFVAAHVLPCWVPLLREQLGQGSGTLVGAPVGFPGGGQTTALKVAEARHLVVEGVEEMDLMMNIGRLRSGHRTYVLDEVRAVVEAAAPVPVKVIIEAHWLSADEIREACTLCIEARAAFVKTGTGWVAGGATLANVELITGFVGKQIGVKAAGGVRGLDTLRTMLGLGVSRFGINAQAALEIMQACDQLPGGFIVV